MASSYNTHKDFDPLEEDEEWLELGLGLGFNTACRKPQQGSNSVSATASSSSSHQRSELGLELQPGLGFDNEGVRNMGVAPPSHNYLSLWPHHNHNHDMPSLTLFTSPSWPCHLDPSSFLGLRNRHMPVPDHIHTHDYSRRPQSGLWFTLRSSINRDGEVLPQIPKAYIRVKDENVTVFMVKTYLVTKLGLSNEAEIDISCMGQKLLHSQTLKHVRDAIWLPRLIEYVNPSAELIENSHDRSINHLMSLHYGRRCFLNHAS